MNADPLRVLNFAVALGQYEAAVRASERVPSLATYADAAHAKAIVLRLAATLADDEVAA